MLSGGGSRTGQPPTRAALSSGIRPQSAQEARDEGSDVFVNLYTHPELGEDFHRHNFDEASVRMSSPSGYVQEYCWSLPPSRVPEPWVLSALSSTLSERCCRAFLEAHRGFPITARDYYLSKLYQFFIPSALDEGMDPDHWASAPGNLEAWLDETLPEGNPEILGQLRRIDWVKLFRDGQTKRVEFLVRNLPNYLGRSSTQAEYSAHFIKRRCAEKTFTQADLAEKSGVNETQIRRLMRGQNIVSSSLVAVADTLECSTDELLGRKPPRRG